MNSSSQVILVVHDFTILDAYSDFGASYPTLSADTRSRSGRTDLVLTPRSNLNCVVYLDVGTAIRTNVQKRNQSKS